MEFRSISFQSKKRLESILKERNIVIKNKPVVRIRKRSQSPKLNNSKNEELGIISSKEKSLSKEQKVKVFTGLQGRDFRHPLDQTNTQLLKSIPGLETIVKGFIGSITEELLLLENISSSVKVGPNQIPSIYQLIKQAASILEMDTPDLYIKQSPTPNAYTLAISGRKPFIVLHTSLLELLNKKEIQAVIAHELGHLKCDHGIWLTAANVIAMGTETLLPVISNTVREGLLRWLRAAELTCDRAMLLVTQNRDIAISTLMKLAGGSPSYANELNIDAFLKQAYSYEEASSSPLGWYLRNAQTRALSHPLPVLRAREIDRWFKNPVYMSLIKKNIRRDNI